MTISHALENASTSLFSSGFSANKHVVSQKAQLQTYTDTETPAKLINPCIKTGRKARQGMEWKLVLIPVNCDGYIRVNQTSRQIDRCWDKKLRRVSMCL